MFREVTAMTGQKERSIEELYRDDPESADALVFGRETGPSRRGFLGGAGLATMCTAVGATIPYSDDMPAGLIPAAMAQSAAPPPASTSSDTEGTPIPQISGQE
jgi:sulfite oxidase